jgi:hypothetical protein
MCAGYASQESVHQRKVATLKRAIGKLKQAMRVVGDRGKEAALWVEDSDTGDLTSDCSTGG